MIHKWWATAYVPYPFGCVNDNNYTKANIKYIIITMLHAKWTYSMQQKIKTKEVSSGFELLVISTYDLLKINGVFQLQKLV